MSRRFARPRLGPLLLLAALTAHAACVAPGCRRAPAAPLRVSAWTAPPMGGLSSDGRPRGFVADALSSAAARSGIVLAWVVVEGGEAEQERALLQGSVDLLVGIPSEARQRSFYVSEPWWSVELSTLLPWDSPIVDVRGLQGVRLAYPQGLGPELPRTFEPSTLVSAPNAAGVAGAVCAGDADAGLVGTIYFRELLFSNSGACAGTRVRVLDATASVDYALIARRGSADAAKALRAGIEQITADGTLTRIAAENPPVSTPHASHLARLMAARAERRFWVTLALSAIAGSVVSVVMVVVLARARRRLAETNAALARDIEAREDAEDSLRESETRFRTLVEAAPDAVVVVQGGRLVFVNAAALRLLGATDPSQLIGTDPLDRVRPEDRESTAARMKAVGVGSGLREVTYVRVDGSTVPVETTAVSFTLGRGPAHLVFARDVSARKVLEAERVRLEHELQQAQKLESIGRLAGGVAHDFNNLLLGIMSHTDLCRDALPANHAGRAHLDAISDAAERSAAITRQLLAFARKQTITPVVLDLNDHVAGTLKLLRRLIGEDIDLVWRPGAASSLVKLDPSQLDQVLANLAVNARDAIEGNGQITIESQLADVEDADGQAFPDAVPGPYVVLSVSDTGAGMDRDTLAQIFEPFFTTKPVGKGTGLGLATVYGIVRQNGGFVAVESAPGRGTTFRLYFRRHLDALDAPGQAEPAPEVRGGTETILLVEDERAVRVTATLVLQALGYTVLAAERPEQALETVARHAGPIHLVLTDVVMPGMNGRELAARVAALRPEARFVFISGYPADVFSRAGIVEKDLAFLAKPFSRAQLAAKIREVLDAG